MARLIIKNFSCIDDADVTLAPLTILIGPQASGKSVISKLVYFFYNEISNVYEYISELEERTFDQYSDLIQRNFKKWFPAQAWGANAFAIEFIVGPISIRISRSKPRKNSIGNLRLYISDFLKDTFASVQADIGAARDRISVSKDERTLFGNLEVVWKIQKSIQSKLRGALGGDFVASQLFIPAGRSFFSSMGKAVVAFEHGGFLDPLTITFGKHFLVMRDQLGGRRFYLNSSRSEKNLKELSSLRERLSEQLFSGTIKVDKNEEYIESKDGRKIPFAIMSSGQQELLPLWLALNEFFDRESANHFVYIEEPEAHLFPLAQGILTEYFATLLGASQGQKMLITTHSPYILAKINNLLKAGSLAAKSPKKIQNAIEDILPKQAWLTPGTTAAYAIMERKVVSILGEDGLIDGEYLDSISGEISRDFNRLLEIEYVK